MLFLSPLKEIKEPRTLKILLSILVLLFVLLMKSTLVDLTDRYNQINNSFKKIEIKEQQYSNWIKNRVVIKKNISSLLKRIDQYKKQLIPISATAHSFTVLDSLAKKNKIVILKIYKDKTIPSEQYSRHLARVSISGYFPNIVSFLKDLENNFFFIRVNSYKLNLKRFTSQKLEMSILFEFIYKTGKIL